MIMQMSEAKAKVFACLTDPPEIHRRDLQKRLTLAVRHRPSDDEVSELFVARLKLLFARLPLAMDLQACATGALQMVKLGFQVVLPVFKLVRNAWMVAPHGTYFTRPLLWHF